MSIFDLYYQDYDAWYEKNRFVYLSELEVLRNVIPKNKIGIEIGVGTGRFALPLNINLGIDPSKKMLEIARHRGVKVCRGHGEKLPFADHSFDFVAMINTLCFVDDPLKVLKESHRVLKDEGDLILGIIDGESFLGAFYRAKKSMFYENAIFFSVPQLTELIENAGFGRCSYCQTVFSLPDEVISVEQPLEGFGQGGFVVIKAHKK